MIDKAECVSDNLYVLNHGEDNVVFAIVDGSNVVLPEFVCSLLYDDALKSIVNRCYQTTSTKQSQVVEAVDGKFGIDLDRASGPEAIWKNKDGMRTQWRDNYELLIDVVCLQWGKRNG